MTARRCLTAWLVAVAIHALGFADDAMAEPWTRADVRALPDEAFAVVHVRPDGTRVRHLPHHDADGRVDPAHLRSGLARPGQVRWEAPIEAERARQHMRAHQPTLGAERRSARHSANGSSR